MANKISFEQACQDLQNIINKIESGEVTLEQATELFEQGKELIKVCYDSLTKSKGKLTEIKQSLDKLEEI